MSPVCHFAARRLQKLQVLSKKQTKLQFNTFLPSPPDVYLNAVITELQAVLFYFTCGE